MPVFCTLLETCTGMTDSSDAELEPSVQLMDKMLQDLGDEDVLAAERSRVAADA